MNMIGKEIDGRYEILEEIGKGGMAHVYKSRDKALNRLVAVKVLKEDYKDDKAFIRRFNVEAQAAASLSNPHIVSIYDVGCEDGLHYIVMEYIEGETLKEYIDRVGVIPWREAAEYSIQICEGIEEAHNNSVIHRDIKPQNIIMTPDGVLKVTDFGIARASTQTTTTIASSSTIGTAHYLSPEQARGGYTDERTDIYSMGVVMYEMLTGKLPFDDSSAVAIAIKHLQETATPITEINPDVPSSLERIVMKAMSKEQSERYASISDMIADINRVLINPESDIFSRRGSSDAITVDDDLSSTIKLPSLDNTEKTGGSNIPGIDFDDYDEQDREYDAMERLNEKRASRLKKKKNRKVGFIAFLSALIFLAAAFAVTFAVTDGFGIFGNNSEQVQVPNIVGMTLKDAQSQYGSEFSIIEQSKEESTLPADTIISQSPEAGTSTTNANNIIIRVVVSAGNVESFTLDDYTGRTYDEAKADLESKGLICNKIDSPNASVEEGIVFEQSRAKNTKVFVGDEITLTVSSGVSNTSEPNKETETEKNENNTSSQINSSEKNTAVSSDDDDSSSHSSGVSAGGSTNSSSNGSSNNNNDTDYDDDNSSGSYSSSYDDSDSDSVGSTDSDSDNSDSSSGSAASELED